MVAATLSGEREKGREVASLTTPFTAPRYGYFVANLRSGDGTRLRASPLVSSLPLSLPPFHGRGCERGETNEKSRFFLFFRERESVIRAGDSRQRRKSGADNWPLKHAPRGLMHIIASIMCLRLLRPLSRPATRALANFPSMT